MKAFHDWVMDPVMNNSNDEKSPKKYADPHKGKLYVCGSCGRPVDTLIEGQDYDPQTDYCECSPTCCL